MIYNPPQIPKAVEKYNLFIREGFTKDEALGRLTHEECVLLGRWQAKREYRFNKVDAEERRIAALWKGCLIGILSGLLFSGVVWVALKIAIS